MTLSQYGQFLCAAASASPLPLPCLCLHFYWSCVHVCVLVLQLISSLLSPHSTLPHLTPVSLLKVLPCPLYLLLLHRSAPALREKLSVLAVMEAVFVRAPRDRQIALAAIAQAAQVPLSEVELLVMRALSLGLVKGEIDEVTQTARLPWVQPRVLDLTQARPPPPPPPPPCPLFSHVVESAHSDSP